MHLMYLFCLNRYLNLNTNELTYEDGRLMLEARKYNLPYEVGLIEFDVTTKKLK